MADPTSLEQTDVRLGLLRDVAAGLVVDDEQCMPTLHLHIDEPPPPSGPTRVSPVTSAPVGAGVWEMERHGWVVQGCGEWRWDLTDYGRSVLEEADRG
jgi:hypothetical protein